MPRPNISMTGNRNKKHNIYAYFDGYATTTTKISEFSRVIESVLMLLTIENRI
jgi:hypothetical protein